MKNLVSMSIVLILSSNFSCVLSAHFSQENIPLKYLTKFTGGQPTLHRYHHGQVVKRQSNDESTPTPEDNAICDAQINDIECTAGIQQGLIEAGLSCNLIYRSIKEAQKDANLCAKGEGGQFCGSHNMGTP
jgi:hypothetical protein